ncbi:hypothetical protein QBC43DRAFT_282949 [Cladorrhinum sp. PSN259]|nr:hypothetical protein QBC43DRAFT_282949 [Cladorrhinum sp. PSN259]
MATVQHQDEGYRTQPHGKFNIFYRFFDLPRELQDQILEEICLFPNGVLVHSKGVIVSPVGFPAEDSLRHYMCSHDEEKEMVEDGLGVVEAAPPLDLFLSGSDELYQNALEIYYGRNTFHLDLRPSGKSGGFSSSTNRQIPRSMVQRFLTGFWKGKTMVRSLVLYCRRISTMSEFIPSLKEMVLGASLRRLQVNLLETPLVHSRRTLRTSGGTDLTKTSVFRQLIALLADPDLEISRMRVGTGAHSLVWCPFHEEVKGEKQQYSVRLEGDQESRKILACRLAYPSDAWLEIDVPKLLEAHGGVMTEFKVFKFDADQER